MTHLGQSRVAQALVLDASTELFHTKAKGPVSVSCQWTSRLVLSVLREASLVTQ